MGRREWYLSISRGEKEIPAGCMSGMLHFFDLHHVLFNSSGSRAAQSPSPAHQQHYPSHQLEGIEAPRNSLELDEATASALAEEYYRIPVGIQVMAVPSLLEKQSKKKNKKDLLSLVEEEKKMNSQTVTPRTPNVVARLMGLEILSDGGMTPTLGSNSQALSPRISMNNKDTRKESLPCRQPLQKRNTNLLPNGRFEMGYRSLPDTPRASTERSRDGDARLSLQINKENSSNYRANYLCTVTHSLPPSPMGGCMRKPAGRLKESSFRSREEEKSSRSHYYAREIVKQVKENIRENSNAAGAGIDDLLNKSRRTRPAHRRVSVENADFEQYFTANLSASPSPPPRRPRPQPALPYKSEERVEAKPIKMEPASKCKKASYEKFTVRIKRQPPQSETATQPVPVPLSSSPTNLSAFSQKHSKKGASRRQLPLASPERVRSAPVVPTHDHQQSLQFQRQSIDTKEQHPEFLYIKSILERGGFTSTDITQERWYSPSHPIDPFVFHQLELDLTLFRSLNGPGPLRHRCNRKLLFHLVEELLSDPHKKPRLHETNRESLLDRVWTRIRSLPLANCQVIEDIDALVAGDLAEARFRRLLGHPLVAAEAERVALEVEEDVLDSIIGEAAATLALGPWAISL